MANPRKPEALKALSGTVKRTRIPKPGSEIPTLSILPDPPAWLTAPAALAEYKRLGNILVTLGGLTEAAHTPFSHYCALHAAIVEMYEAGKIPRPPEIAQFLAFAKAFRAVGTSSALAVPAPNLPENPFEKFKTRATL